MKIEPVVKKWYDALEEGKLMGMRCKDCGAYSFPPVPICNKCGCMEVEWVEVSGEGTLLTAEVDAAPMHPYEDRGPLVAGFVKLKEGPDFITWITDLTPEEKANVVELLPMEVKFVIDQRDGFKYPVVVRK